MTKTKNCKTVVYLIVSFFLLTIGQAKEIIVPSNSNLLTLHPPRYFNWNQDTFTLSNTPLIQSQKIITPPLVVRPAQNCLDFSYYSSFLQKSYNFNQMSLPEKRSFLNTLKNLSTEAKKQNIDIQIFIDNFFYYHLFHFHINFERFSKIELRNAAPKGFRFFLFCSFPNLIYFDCSLVDGHQGSSYNQARSLLFAKSFPKLKCIKLPWSFFLLSEVTSFIKKNTHLEKIDFFTKIPKEHFSLSTIKSFSENHSGIEFRVFNPQETIILLNKNTI